MSEPKRARGRPRKRLFDFFCSFKKAVISLDYCRYVCKHVDESENCSFLNQIKPKEVIIQLSKKKKCKHDWDYHVGFRACRKCGVIEERNSKIIINYELDEGPLAWHPYQGRKYMRGEFNRDDT